MRPIAILLAGALTIVAVGMAVSAAQPDPATSLKSVQAFSAIPTTSSARWRCSRRRARSSPMPAASIAIRPAIVRRRATTGTRTCRSSCAASTTSAPSACAARRATARPNFDPAGVPGHPEWHVAPIEMAWVGKSLGEICQQIKDPAAQRRQVDGGADPSYGRGFRSSAGDGTRASGRQPAPGTQKEFGELIKAWVDTGAVCPAT